MKPYQPRPYAPLVMQHLAALPRANVFARPGMGKSVMTMTHLEHLHNVWGEDRPTLVLAPLRVARDTWTTEARKWNHLRGLEVSAVIGDAKQRKAALRKDAQIYTTNYENLPWLREQFPEWPFATVVADESTMLKGFRVKQGGIRAQAIGRVAHTKVERWINLTGTPASNGLRDLWGQMWFIDAGQRLGRTFSAFEERWFRPIKNSDGYFNWVPTEYAQTEIQERIADVSVSLSPRDWFDIAEPVVTTVEVELPPKAKALYREFERELFTLISGSPVEAMNAAAKSGKCLQLAGGAVYGEDGKAWVELHQEKLDALAELADQTGDEPLLVVYNYRHEAERIAARFSGALELSRKADLDAAREGRGKLWLAHPASLGHGVDGLQEHCHTVVYFGQTWNLEHREQVLERVGPMRQMQAGKDREVFVYNIIARGTIDSLVAARVDGKQRVQDLLMNYLKGKQK